MTAPRQTVTFLQRRFAEVGLQVNHRFGQNFMIDMNLQSLLVRAAEIQPTDVVLEVGTGSGALTALLAQEAAAVVSVEIDPQLHQLASEELFHVDNVTLLQQDALAGKSQIAPEVLSAVESRLVMPARRWHLAANLPYCIATPLMATLLELDHPPARMTVTIQKELAQRMVAAPASADFSALSLWVQSQCRAELVRILPPEVFWPKPKVDSAILRLDFDPALRARMANRHFYHQLVRGLFCHRRKFLRSALILALGDRLDKGAIDAVLTAQGLGPSARAEAMSVDQMIALANALEAVLPNSE